MRTTAIKLIICVIAVPMALVLTRLTGSGWFMGLWAIAFPLMVLYAMDYGRELRHTNNPSRLIRGLALLVSIPQAMFGLLTLAFGLAMIAWVLYNSLIERQPEYSGGFLTFGIGPICVLVGGGWVVSAFRRA